MIYVFHEGINKELGCQSWYGRESLSSRNAEHFFRNIDKIIQGNTCFERIEAMKVIFVINDTKEEKKTKQEQYENPAATEYEMTVFIKRSWDA